MAAESSAVNDDMNHDTHAALSSEVPGTPVDSTHFTMRNLSVFYRDRAALRDLSFGIRRDAVTAIVGPSGCGKSTFLHALNRLIDLVPGCRTEGQIVFDGEDILRPEQDLVALRKRVGMVFQKPNPFPVSIQKNLLIPLREHRYPRPRWDEIVERALRDVGLWDEVHSRLNGAATSLSGGQQQRLCIARALVLDPEVVLFDEPCSALDPKASGIIERLITDLCKRVTVVVVTHNLAQARRIAHDVAVFGYRDDAGTLLDHGEARMLLATAEDA